MDIKKETRVLGGAGNVIANLISLGADVGVMSVIGDDEVGSELKNYAKYSKRQNLFLVEEKK